MNKWAKVVLAQSQPTDPLRPSDIDTLTPSLFHNYIDQYIIKSNTISRISCYVCGCCEQFVARPGEYGHPSCSNRLTSQLQQIENTQFFLPNGINFAKRLANGKRKGRQSRILVLIYTFFFYKSKKLNIIQQLNKSFVKNAKHYWLTWRNIIISGSPSK